MAEVRRRTVRQWESPEDFVRFIRYGYLLKDRPLVPATMRAVVRDANGDEVVFPMAVNIEFTFHNA